MTPRFFATPEELRAWLEEHHQEAGELWVGFWKQGSGRPSITWAESVDEALCFGWIDGIRKSLDGDSYVIRFTPRKPRSTWSAVNVRRVEELTRLGRMTAAGIAAFEARSPERTGVYSFEQESVELAAPYATRLRANARASEFFEAQAASYRKAAAWWVMSAKREETRARRLALLVEDSAHGRRLAHLSRRPR